MEENSLNELFPTPESQISVSILPHEPNVSESVYRTALENLAVNFRRDLLTNPIEKDFFLGRLRSAIDDVQIAQRNVPLPIATVREKARNTYQGGSELARALK